LVNETILYYDARSKKLKVGFKYMIFLLSVSAYSDCLQGGVVGIHLDNHSLFIPKERGPGFNRIGSWVDSQRYICCPSCESVWREPHTKHSTL